MYNFKQNKYYTYYFNLINKAKQRSSSGYIERHHIVPKSLGGNNDPTNIVELTAREHFVCHMLLTRFVQDKDKHKMSYASWQLSHRLQRSEIMIISSRLYQRLKINLSETYKGRKRAKFSDEWINNMKLRAIGEKNGMYGRSHSEETKKLISENRKGKATGKDNPFYGKQHSEETIRKIKEGGKKRRGIPKPKKECPHCGRLIAINLFTRFHGDNCKFKL